MRLSHVIPVLFIVLESCVDPLKIELLAGTQKFVVDGLITNEPGPYEVKLSYSTSVDNALKKAPIATGASVWIYDNLNNVEKLVETSPGTYATSVNGIRGQIGRSYYVKIKTKFAREYQSNPQRLSPAGEITHVSFQFVSAGLKSNNPEEYIDAATILIDAKGVEGEQNLFRWRWATTYGVLAFPQYRMKYTMSGAEPWPETCSGYIVDGGAPRSVRQIAPCTCCNCWPHNVNSLALISHNRIVDGLEFKKIELGNIPVGTQQFYEKYYVDIEQLSVSEDAYDFWNLVEKQQSGNGNLFQPNSIKIKGNIQSLTDSDEEVLGIFGVSGIARKRAYITSDVVPYKLPPLDSVKQACASAFQNVSITKPVFW